jgi:hypothetical protein
MVLAGWAGMLRLTFDAARSPDPDKASKLLCRNFFGPFSRVPVWAADFDALSLSNDFALLWTADVVTLGDGTQLGTNPASPSDTLPNRSEPVRERALSSQEEFHGIHRALKLVAKIKERCSRATYLETPGNYVAASPLFPLLLLCYYSTLKKNENS